MNIRDRFSSRAIQKDSDYSIDHTAGSVSSVQEQQEIPNDESVIDMVDLDAESGEKVHKSDKKKKNKKK